MANAAELGSSDAAFAPKRLEADIRLYADHKDHQTGGVGDLATVAWVETRLKGAGFDVRRQPVTTPYFEASEVSLQVGDDRVACLAQHPVRATGAQGLTTRLALRLGREDESVVHGAIAVVLLPFARHSSLLTSSVRAALESAASGGAVAVVAITDGPSGEAIALNAPEDALFGEMPIVTLGRKAAGPVIAGARANRTATLVVRGEGGHRTSANLLAARPGPGKAIVVSTPLSGWFRCAGERGGGVATFLALAAWLPKAYPGQRLLFVGTVGHEFENRGSRAFFKSGAPPRSEVGLWVHLGANFAARDFHETPSGLLPLQNADPQRFLLASEEIAPVVAKAMAGLPGLERIYPATARYAAGEAREILAAGYGPLIANYGNHRFHHTVLDLPEVTSGELVSAAGVALRNAVAQLLALRNRS